MSDFAQQYVVSNRGSIGCFTSELGRSIPVMRTGYLSGSGVAYPADNRGYFQPFVVQQRTTLTNMAFVYRGGSVNYDVGIYDMAGNRIYALGSTAISGAAATVNVDITDTTLSPGYYMMAFWCSSTSGNFDCMTSAPALVLAANGVRSASSLTSALPASVTYVETADAYVPRVAGFYRTTF